MAILSALLGLIARQVTTIVQAIFGWSITALFGKLPSRKQTALSVALALSIVWPLLVLGCFLPAAAAWAVAFVPLHKVVADGVLRIIWIALAVLVPLGVGAITRWITPADKLRGGLPLTLLGGYPITLAYFLAFLLTAVTVPIVKILSAIARWDDCHVYVQPKEGRYFEVLDALIEACKRANVVVVRENVPAPMALSTNVIQKLASPFMQPALATRPQRLRGGQLEVYLYSADLLLRGEAHALAHVRAAMSRTELEDDAYLVQAPEAQALQDDVQRLSKAARQGGTSDAEVSGRIVDLARRLDRAPIAFEEWTVLEGSLRRIERRLSGKRDLLAAGSDNVTSAPSAPSPAAPQRRSTPVPHSPAVYTAPAHRISR